MRILLTGANGFVGRELLARLLENGHFVYCCVRDSGSFEVPVEYVGQVEIVEVDFLEGADLTSNSIQADTAYYLIHSLIEDESKLLETERTCAKNFLALADAAGVKEIIYLGGIVNDSPLSPHLQSRLEVEQVLMAASIPCISLRAGVIIGSDSSSFKFMNELVQKMPVMVADSSSDNQCQPIAIENVVDFLVAVRGRKELYGEAIDIGGQEILTYRQMIRILGQMQGRDTTVFTVPFKASKSSNFWLQGIKSIPVNVATHLLDSMKLESVCRYNEKVKEMGVALTPIRKALRKSLSNSYSPGE